MAGQSQKHQKIKGFGRRTDTVAQPVPVKPPQVEVREETNTNFILEQVKEILELIYKPNEPNPGVDGLPNPNEGDQNPDKPITERSLMKFFASQLTMMNQVLTKSLEPKQEPEQPLDEKAVEEELRVFLNDLTSRMKTLDEKARHVFPELSKMAKETLLYLDTFLPDSIS